MVALSKRKKDKFQAFYTDCNHITSYMVNLLKCDNGMSILEPCAGEGAFIDELIRIDKKLEIKTYELKSDSVNVLIDKYFEYKNISLKHEDFLLILELNGCKYDRVIANPPYGAYQTQEKRKYLKNSYPKIYAKETYGLFLIKSMGLLKKNGRLVFIIPDTYLTLHMHEGLRKEILKNYKVESITLFPSNFFPGVNFGYAGLSIISIIKSKVKSTYSFPVYSGLKSPNDFTNLLTEKVNDYTVCNLSYSDLNKNPSSAFFLPSKKWIASVLSSDSQCIGDLCSVVTGFYSGNDGKYLRRSASVTRGIKKYLEVEKNEVCNIDFSTSPPLEGIDNSFFWVPIVKGGNKRFYKNSEWFMNWSKEAVNDYRVKNKKKARFQNSQYYFKNGIGVPMVSSSSITGSLINGRLFDQSIVGIFPKEKYNNLMLFLLGFFNSKICNDLIRTINSSTNNSSNYIKKIPIKIPSDKMRINIETEVNKLIKKSKHSIILNNELEILDGYFYELFEIKT